MKKKKRRGLPIIAVALTLVYFYFFPYSLGKEFCLKPVWAADLTNPGPLRKRAPGERPLAWFRTDKRFGFFNLDGEFHYLDEILFDVSLSSSGFINFAKVSENIVFRDPSGGFQFGFKNYGYPILDQQGERILSVSTDLGGLKGVSREGEVIWSVRFFSPITSLSMAGHEYAAGLLSGTVKLIDERGNIFFEFTPPGSRVPVILGTALRDDGQQLALISGIGPQKLSILNRKENGFSPYYSQGLDSDFRREVMMHYTGDNQFLVFEDSAGPSYGMSVFELRRRRSLTVALPGRLRAVTSSASHGILAAGAWIDSPGPEPVASSATAAPGENLGRSRLVVFHPLFRTLYSGTLPSRDVFLKLVGRHLFIGISDYLLRVDVVEE